MPTNPIPTTPNLKAYYKADAGLYQDTGAVTPATANGDPVGLWQDQSGNGYHLTQATAGNRPTLATNRFKGLPCVDFLNTSSQWLSNTSFPWTQSKSSGAWVVAAQIDSGSPSSGLVTATQDQLGILCADGGFYAYLNSAAGQSSAVVGVTAQGFVASLVYDGSQSTDATKLRLFRNLNQQTLSISNGPLPATTYAGGATLYMGRQAAGGFLKGRIIEAAFFSSLSDVNRAAIVSYLGQTYFSRATADLIAKGDSRTIGYPGTWNQVPPLTGTDSYPLHARVLLGSSRWTLTNLGIGGTTWAIWAGSPGDARSLQDDWAAAQAVVCFGGVNDRIAGRTPVQTEANVTTWVAAMVAIGFTHIFVCTEPWDTATADADQTAFDTWLRSHVAGLGATLVDFQADPRFADDAAAGSATNYSDGTHQTDAGAAALAGILVPYLSGLLPSSGNARSYPRGVNRGLNRGVA